MNNLNHSRKRSIRETTMEEHTEIPTSQLCKVKSTKDSPNETGLHWLKSTQRDEFARNNSDKKMAETCSLVSKAALLIFPKPHQDNNFRMPAPQHCQSIAKLPKPQLKPLILQPPFSLESALYLVQAAIKECSVQHAMMGCSSFNINSCYLNQEGELVIRLNSDLGHVSTPTFDEALLVRDVIEAVYKLCQPKVFEDFYAYYKRSLAKTRCDFKFTLSLIKSYCSCSKISIANKISDTKPNQKQKEKEKKDKDKQALDHPKSAQKISSFVRQMITSKVNRRTVSTKNRVNVDPMLQSRGRPNNKNQTSIHYLVTEHSLEKKISNKIEIRPQFDMVVSSKVCLQVESVHEEMTSSCKKDGKISSVSTNFGNLGDYMEPSNSNLKCKFSGLGHRNSEYKEYFSFLPADLDEVQSLGSSSDHESQLPTRRNDNYETPHDTHLEHIKRENENRILSINNWTRRLSCLLSEQRQIQQSMIHEDSTKQKKQSQADSVQLGKMVRAVAESILPGPSEFRIRQYQC